MKARHQVYLALVALGLTLVALALRVVNAFEGGFHRSDWEGVAVTAPMVAVPLILLAQARRLEAEHGPDYAPPMKHGRTVLAVAAVVAAVLGAVAIGLIVRR